MKKLSVFAFVAFVSLLASFPLVRTQRVIDYDAPGSLGSVSDTLKPYGVLKMDRHPGSPTYIAIAGFLARNIPHGSLPLDRFLSWLMLGLSLATLFLFFQILHEAWPGTSLWAAGFASLCLALHPSFLWLA